MTLIKYKNIKNNFNILLKVCVCVCELYYSCFLIWKIMKTIVNNISKPIQSDLNWVPLLTYFFHQNIVVKKNDNNKIGNPLTYKSASDLNCRSRWRKMKRERVMCLLFWSFCFCSVCVLCNRPIIAWHVDLEGTVTHNCCFVLKA
jgi:hypothetical protein